MVPTLAVVHALSKFVAALGFPAKSLEKLASIAPSAMGALELLHRAQVRVGFGTDLIGELHRHQCSEFALRREVLSTFEILRSATSVNADILRAGDYLGRIAPGYAADLIVIDGNPLEDLCCFTEDGRHVSIIVKDGALLKAPP